MNERTQFGNFRRQRWMDDTGDIQLVLDFLGMVLGAQSQTIG
jgi:hypothetical protein